MTTWQVLIEKEMKNFNDSFVDLLYSTLTKEELNVEFDDGYGSPKGKPFTLWTKNRVYFPLVYDGSEDVGSVAREPDGVVTRHMGVW